MNTNKSFPTSRRQFLSRSMAALAAVSVVPSHVLGVDGKTPPSGKINLAGVGVGGVGYSQLRACNQAGFNIVALCDIDDVYAKKAFNKWPQARRYRDFRDLLRTEADKVDAVYVGTPDHTHALVTVAALRRKKHVCCVKPLTRTRPECAAVLEAARQAKTATQMTASPNNVDVACRTCELIWAGAIGAIREVHIWTDRPLWPQGMMRPAGQDPIPETFDWKMWIGPAPMRPFRNKWADTDYPIQQVNRKTVGQKGVYHPWNFRGWWDFGNGALGDMGCHHFNTPYRALKLTHPTRIQANSTKVFAETAPLSSIVTYDFPARSELPPVRIVWYDGGLKPPSPQELEGRPLPAEGVLYIGEKGKMLGPKVLPATPTKFEDIPKTLPRFGNPFEQWFTACAGGTPAGCEFEWGCLLTEAVLIGNATIRAEKSLDWDASKMRFTNDEAANRIITQPYENGWSLETV